jgi:hypothetical protein
MAKIFGGSASRLEVYALFVAAVVLIGGGIGGAIVVTSGDETSAPTTVVEISSTTVTTAVPVEVTAPSTTAAPAVDQLPRPTTRYVEPPPVTSVPDQPVQDFSAYCTMPDVVGVWAYKSPGYGVGGISYAGEVIRDAGCPGVSLVKLVCYDPTLGAPGTIRITSTNPIAGTLVHRSLGSISIELRQTTEGFNNNPEPLC